MDSPGSMIQTISTEDSNDGVEDIVRTFLIEQERINASTSRTRRNSVVDQIFRGHGQQVQGSDRSPPNSDVGRQLAEIAAQLDEHYFRDETDQYINTLERRPENRMDNLRRIIHGVFQSGITAGHVMSLLIFGYRYIHHIINKGIEGGEDICREIINSIISFVRVTVVSWIKSIGGWNGFLDEVKTYVMNQIAFWSRHGQEIFVGVIVVLTAVNVGALLWHYK